MYLKRVEILGFKSFAEKTELEFGPGITAVVGPNGSGKSNVADAVRWVLGEQSARALRGGQMADVIFAGSDGRKAMGFAQVNLVLDNADGRLGVGFAEVMVTRRVDRSGEGEYFINQVPCRLKDVHDLFLDTGVGKENYSIIGQGKIDEILSSKPEDRRALFEEAAGISRYKARKREAQRRLEETEQNLLRITDVTGELTLQIGSLAEQAQRAEVYTRLHGELTRLDIGLLAHSLQSAAARLGRQRQENLQLTGKGQELEQRLQVAEQAAEVARSLAESLEQELSLVQSRVAEATGRLERAEGQQALSLQEQQAAAAEGERLEGEMVSLQAKLDQLVAEAQAVAEQARGRQADLAALMADLTAAEQSCLAAQAEVAAANQTVEERKDRIVAILQQEAERRNGASAAQRAADEAARRMARLTAERERAEVEAGDARAKMAALGVRQIALSEERDRLMGQVAGLKAERQRAEQLLQEMQHRGSTLREELQGSRSRLGAIEEMISGFEGYQRGARTILQGREKGLPFAAEVLGAVAELIRTDPAYEKAVEIALGGNVQNIITQTDRGAKQAIEHLKQVGGGRATFLPLSTIRPNSFRPDEEREFRDAPGILGPALELVRFEERYRPAMASLLGRVLIARDLDAALALGKKSGMRYRVVTLDGELLAAGGALTGGSIGGQGSGLLTRERERDELTAAVARLQAELAAAGQAYETAKTGLAAVDGQISAREQELRAAEAAVAQVDGEAARLEGEIRRWEDVLKTFAAEAELIAAENAEGAEQAGQIQTELARLAVSRGALERELSGLQADVGRAGSRLDERVRERTALQVRQAELTQEVRSLGAQQARLESDRSTLAAEQTARQEQRARAARRLEQAEVAVTGAQAALREAADERAAADMQRERLQQRRLEVLEQVNDRDREMRSLRRSQSETQARLQQGELELARLEMEEQHLTERLQEQHQLTPADLDGRALAETELEPARLRSAELKEELRELGPVNLQAIEEHKAARERLLFLEQQRDDLEEAKGSLYRAVEELEKRIKTHFLESFHQIRREFQRVYQELFEGGKADLQLVDETDLLETGIEIMAQPPGKKPQPLSLLSGGERAMTAIALLFALLRVKPSPFVVLDEVEAALDEANVERFGKYLRGFSGQGCQFVCITHQRGTMEVADALYGVTMEGTGISKVVSVRLIDVQREAS